MTLNQLYAFSTALKSQQEELLFQDYHHDQEWQRAQNREDQHVQVTIHESSRGPLHYLRVEQKRYFYVLMPDSHKYPTHQLQ